MNVTVKIRYTNWMGETCDRMISPVQLIFGSTVHHPEEQWLLVAVDIEKKDRRTFAMKGIASWTPVS